jgi:hypothetical protein
LDAAQPGTNRPETGKKTANRVPDQTASALANRAKHIFSLDVIGRDAGNNPILATATFSQSIAWRLYAIGRK